jgi:hypothetical protein
MAVALAALVVAIGGAAFAAIPDSGGTVHACYQKVDGGLRVVESENDCRSSEKPLALSTPGQSVGGREIVARARSTGPFPVTQASSEIPLTDNTWNQGANETNELFLEVTVSVPPPGCASSQVDFFVDGERMGSAVYGGVGAGGSGTIVRRIPTFLLDPGTSKSRTVSARVLTDPTTGTTCGAVVESVRVNVAAMS